MTVLFSLMDHKNGNVKKPELLAPAGNYDCFLAALGAGADAVYLAGNRFGARAFADNFSEEELLGAIRYAHLFSRKVYLTVNTLLKDRELVELGAYLAPLVRAGLDAVIVQDFGALALIRQEFPDLAVHCSTQMTLTTSAGIEFAGRLGAKRVVPARELTLAEIRQIKDLCPDIELECFIHGAMCYCYSGQCLMSSMLGARSGNRGRCAQPCRLPYTVSLSKGSSGHASLHAEQTRQLNAKDSAAYPLSLKDMSTLALIPELIAAGIDSFKIEGRMKSPEYSAGVTSVYRAVIDRFCSDPQRFLGPTKQECDFLEKLYVRGDVSEGYYHRRNGKEMITSGQGGYRGCDETVLREIRERYVRSTLSLPVQMKIELKIGMEAKLSVSCRNVTVTCTGDTAEQSKSRPLTEENIRAQLGKTGGTVFEAASVYVEKDESVFYALGKLNELRRCALAKLETALCENERGASFANTSKCVSLAQSAAHRAECGDAPYIRPHGGEYRYTVSVMTKQQLETSLAHPLPLRIIAEPELLETCAASYGNFSRKVPLKPVLLALPRILRERDLPHVKETLLRFLDKSNGFSFGGDIAGIMVHTQDGYALAASVCEAVAKDPRDFIFGSPFLYHMNALSARFWSERIQNGSFSYELHEKEINELAEKMQSQGLAPLMLPIYGHIPVMVTANCLAKSFAKEGCVHKDGVMYLKDRTGREFPVIRNCRYCFNTIYNGITFSLHKHRKKLAKLYREGMIGSFLLSFTTEDADKTKAVLDYYHADADAQWNLGEYTNGHFQKGVD